MLKISKSVEYSILAIRRINLHNEEKFLTAKDISELENIPFELLAKLLQKMKKNGLIDSVQGKFGGYKLTKNLDEITLFSVVEAIDLDIQLTDCSFPNAQEDACGRFSQCFLRMPLVNIQEKIVELFRNLKLSEIITT